MAIKPTTTEVFGQGSESSEPSTEIAPASEPMSDSEQDRIDAIVSAGMESPEAISQAPTIAQAEIVAKEPRTTTEVFGQGSAPIEPSEAPTTPTEVFGQGSSSVLSPTEQLRESLAPEILPFVNLSTGSVDIMGALNAGVPHQIINDTVGKDVTTGIVNPTQAQIIAMFNEAIASGSGIPPGSKLTGYDNKTFSFSYMTPEQQAAQAEYDKWASQFTSSELSEINSGKYKVPDPSTGQMVSTTKSVYNEWVGAGSPTSIQMMMQQDIYRDWISQFNPQEQQEIESNRYQIADPTTNKPISVTKQMWKDYSDRIVAEQYLTSMGYMVDGGYDIIKVARDIRDGKLDQNVAEDAIGAETLAPVLAEQTEPYYILPGVDMPQNPIKDWLRSIKAQVNVGTGDVTGTLWGMSVPPSFETTLRQISNMVEIVLPESKYSIIDEPLQFTGELGREVFKFIPGYATAEATVGSLIREGEIRPWQEIATAAALDTLFLIMIRGGGAPKGSNAALDDAVSAVLKPHKTLATQLYDTAYGITRTITSIPGTARNIMTSVKLLPYEIRSVTKSVIKNTVSTAKLAKYIANDAVATMKVKVPGIANEVWTQVNRAVRSYLNSPSLSDRLAQSIINNVRFTGYLAKDISMSVSSYLKTNVPQLTNSVMRQINRAYIAYMNSPTVAERVGKLLVDAYRRAGYEATGAAGKITAVAKSIPVIAKTTAKSIENAVIRYLNSPSLMDRLDSFIVDRAKFAVYMGKSLATTLKAEVPQLTTAMVNRIGREITRYFIATKNFPENLTRAALSNVKLTKYIINDILASVKASLPKMSAEAWAKIKTIITRWLNSPSIDERILSAVKKRLEYTKYLAKEVRNGVRDGYAARELGTDIKTTLQAIGQYMKDGNENALRQAGEILENMGKKVGNKTIADRGADIALNPKQYIDAVKKNLTPTELAQMSQLAESSKNVIKKMTPQDAVMEELERRMKPHTIDDLLAGRSGDQITSVAEKVIAEFKAIEATMRSQRSKLDSLNSLIRQIDEGRMSPRDISGIELDTRGMRSMLQAEGYPSFMIDNMLTGLPKSGGSGAMLDLAQLRNYLETEVNLIRRQMARLATRYAELTGDPAMAELWGIEIAKGKPPVRPEPLEGGGATPRSGEPPTGSVGGGGVQTLTKTKPATETKPVVKPRTTPKPDVGTTVTQVKVKPKAPPVKPVVKPETPAKTTPKVDTPSRVSPKTDIPIRAPIPGEGQPHKIVYPEIISFPSREGQQEFIRRLEEMIVVSGKVDLLTDNETTALSDRIDELSKRMTREQAIKQAVEEISRISPATTTITRIAPAIGTSPAAYVAPDTGIQPAVVPTTASAVGIAPAIGADVIPAIEQEVATPPAVDMEIVTEIKPALEIETPVKPAIITKAPPKKPPFPIPFPFPDEGGAKHDLQEIPAGSIAYKKGLFWKWIPPEDFKDGVKPRTLPKGVAPVGADLSGGNSPYTTIQRIGVSDAVVPDRISIDEGIVDSVITSNGSKIGYAGGGLKTNVGDRDPSPTKGMTVGDRVLVGNIVDADTEEPELTEETPVDKEPVEEAPASEYLDEDESWLGDLDPPVARYKKSSRTARPKRRVTRRRDTNPTSFSGLRMGRIQ